MSALHHILIAVCYTVVAAGVAVGLPAFLPALDANTGIVIGGVVLIGSALLHEVFVRQEAEGRLSEELDASRDEVAALRDRLADAEAGMDLMREALAAAELRSDGDEQGRRKVDDVIAEVKVLQGLIEQFSSVRSGGAHAMRSAESRRDPRPAPQDDAEDIEDLNDGPSDAARTLSLVARDGETLAAPDLVRGLDDDAILGIVREGLEMNRVDLVLQPVVSLPQRRRCFYEAFTRIRDTDGQVLTPAQYIGIAEREGLVPTIDNMLLFRCVQLVRRSQSRNHNVGFFCNISAHSLTDRHFFSNFVEFMADNTQLAPNLIFEFPYATIANRDLDIEKHLRQLALLGFRFSVDQVQGLNIDYADLMRLHFKYIKMDAATLLRELHEPQSHISPEDIKRIADRHGMDLIVEKIESEKVLLELLDLRIDYGQGYLFGEPRLARIE
ncbi:MAG: EAL domain-containing protein [Alphaproteobacteria bacterium]|nr:EAL domain-containing protein [Alphaproteobacteria bacterium]